MSSTRKFSCKVRANFTRKTCEKGAIFSYEKGRKTCEQKGDFCTNKRRKRYEKAAKLANFSCQVRANFVSSSRKFSRQVCANFTQKTWAGRANKRTTHTHRHTRACFENSETDRQTVAISSSSHNNKLINLIFQTLTFVDVDVVGDALDYVLQLGQRLCCRLDFFFSFVVHLAAAAAAAADAAVANDGQSAMQASFKEDDACLRPTSQQPGG